MEKKREGLVNIINNNKWWNDWWFLAGRLKFEFQSLIGT